MQVFSLRIAASVLNLTPAMMKKIVFLFLVILNIGLSFAACIPKDNNVTLGNNNNNDAMTDNKIAISVNGHQLTATLVDNSSAQALVELLRKGAVTVQAHEYGGFEMVGTLPQSLPRNDEQITTTAGDIILYQGNSICFYYASNSWNFTRLGRIDNAESLNLKNIFGSGSATFVLSLPEPTAVNGMTAENNAKKTEVYNAEGQLIAFSTDNIGHGVFIVKETLADGTTNTRKVKL